jgi:hypothetical protein
MSRQITIQSSNLSKFFYAKNSAKRDSSRRRNSQISSISEELHVVQFELEKNSSEFFELLRLLSQEKLSIQENTDTTLPEKKLLNEKFSINNPTIKRGNKKSFGNNHSFRERMQMQPAIVIPRIAANGSAADFRVGVLVGTAVVTVVSGTTVAGGLVGSAVVTVVAATVSSVSRPGWRV